MNIGKIIVQIVILTIKFIIFCAENSMALWRLKVIYMKCCEGFYYYVWFDDVLGIL